VSTERWLPIPGYEGRYDVSDLGRVRSWLPWRGEPVPRIRKALVNDNGHLAVSLSNDGCQVTAKVHQLVMLAFVGPRPDGLETRHLDGNSVNSRLDNLTYGTHSENSMDRVSHGTWTNGRDRRIQCKRGHPFDEQNTYLHSGRRHCRTCRHDAQIAALPARARVA